MKGIFILLCLYFELYACREFPIAVTNSTPIGCPDGWTNGGPLGCFYFLYNEKTLNWFEAQEACEMIGGYLAELTTADQNIFVESIAIIEESLTGVKSWWLGLSDIGREGRWVWEHSLFETDFTYWGAGHPNPVAFNQDDCVAIHLSDHFHWKDISCVASEKDEIDSPSPLCQRDVGTMTTPASTTQETTTAYATHVELRGNTTNQGTLWAVNRENVLGPVCDDVLNNSGPKIARIVCRQLGYTDGSFVPGSPYGDTDGVYAMDDLICTGQETYIQDCDYNTIDNCNTREGLGIICNV